MSDQPNSQAILDSPKPTPAEVIERNQEYLESLKKSIDFYISAYGAHDATITVAQRGQAAQDAIDMAQRVIDAERHLKEYRERVLAHDTAVDKPRYITASNVSIIESCCAILRAEEG